MVFQHLTKTLYVGFSSNLSPICSFLITNASFCVGQLQPVSRTSCKCLKLSLNLVLLEAAKVSLSCQNPVEQLLLAQATHVSFFNQAVTLVSTLTHPVTTFLWQLVKITQAPVAFILIRIFRKKNRQRD